EDVVAIGGTAGLLVELHPDILENRLGQIQEFAVGAVQLPEHAGLADFQHGLLVAVIDQDAFIDLVQIQGFAGRVLVVPLHLPGIGVERQSGIREQRIAVGAALVAPRRLGLTGAPIGQIEFGIVGSRDPGIGAGPLVVGQIAPGIAARGAFAA